MGVCGCSELDDTCEGFVKINSEDMFCSIFKMSPYIGIGDRLCNEDIYANDEFAMLEEREALASAIFIMDNKVCVHTRNTYKYQEWDEVLGDLWVNNLSDEFFCLLTDTNDGIPVIGLYKEAVAGIYSGVVNGRRRYVVMDKFTAIVVYHYLYGIATRLLPTDPCVSDDFDHSDMNIDNPKSLELCRRVFDVLQKVDGIADLKEYIAKEDWD